jgi:hypothetical protein
MSEKIKKILEDVIFNLEKVTNKKVKTILKKIKKAKNKI